MHSCTLPRHGDARRLVPFVLLALALHAAMLWGVRWSPASQPLIPVQLNVMFDTSEPDATSLAPSPLLTMPTHEHAAVAAPPPAPVASSAADSSTPARLDARQWLDSNHDLVREEAVKIERAETDREKLRLSTPLAQLQQALHQPHTETRLANGLLKITTESGTSLCYQPAPSFARDMAGLYGIPSTCP
jgi:hypothetical protein